MSGDKNKKVGVTTRSKVEPETEKEGDASKGENGDRAEDGPSPATLGSLRKVVSEVVAEGMQDL